MKAKGGAKTRYVRKLAACDLDEYILQTTSIPDAFSVHHIFTNKDLTIPATKELLVYLWQLYREDKEVLRYLHRKCQEYIKYNGCHVITFANWLEKLEKDLCDTWRNKYGNE